jgi:hypothetical protein
MLDLMVSGEYGMHLCAIILERILLALLRVEWASICAGTGRMDAANTGSCMYMYNLSKVASLGSFKSMVSKRVAG